MTRFDPAIGDILSHPCAFSVMVWLLMDWTGGMATFLYKKGGVDPDEVLALSVSDPLVDLIPRRSLTTWCFAHGATGTKAFGVLCQKRNFWFARWLVTHGATPQAWEYATPGWAYKRPTVPNYRICQQAKLARHVGYPMFVGDLPRG